MNLAIGIILPKPKLMRPYGTRRVPCGTREEKLAAIGTVSVNEFTVCHPKPAKARFPCAVKSGATVRFNTALAGRHGFQPVGSSSAMPSLDTHATGQNAYWRRRTNRLGSET